MFGHAGIFTQTITNSIGQNDEVTIETRIEDGVDNYNATFWTLKHYVLGVQDVKYKLTWQGFTLGIERICTPVSNPGLLATTAESQLGKDYVSAPEFIIPKIVAPTRFTCTSLVWWCAKECYNIDVSDWFSPIVSPSAVYRSENTYVRKSVTP